MSLRGAGKLGLNSSGFPSAFSFCTAKLITLASFSCQGGDDLFFSPRVETTASPRCLFICLASHYFPTRFLCPVYRKTLSWAQQVGNEQCETEKTYKKLRADWKNQAHIHRKWTEPHKASFYKLAAVNGTTVEKKYWHCQMIHRGEEWKSAHQYWWGAVRRNGDKLVGKEASHS